MLQLEVISGVYGDNPHENGYDLSMRRNRQIKQRIEKCQQIYSELKATPKKYWRDPGNSN